METKAHHVLIGAFTLLVITGLVLFALWASKYSSARAWETYDVIFTEAVTGLSVGGVVQYNGIAVGEVRDLSLAENGRVMARIRVKAGTPVKTDTEARLGFTGLTGIAFIQLSGGSPSAPRLAPDRDTVPVIVARQSALQKLLASSEDIATTAAEVMTRVHHLLSEENMQRMSDVIAHIEAVSGTIAADRGDIGALIRDARAAAAGLRGTLESTDRVVRRLDSTMSGIDRSLVTQLPVLVESLRRSLTTLEKLTGTANAALTENRAALANFSNQGLVQVGPALVELRTLLRELSQLSERIEDDPAAFILGGGQPREFEPKR